MDLEICGLCAAYGKRERIHNISFSVKKGEFLALIGRNGSGKSTLVSCIGGVLPYTGEIKTNGVSFLEMNRRERARTVAILPQVITAPHITVEELVSFGRNPYLKIGESFSEKDRTIVESALADAMLLSLRKRYVNTLSGGERRRAYLGMILAQDTPIIVLDEATANMDMAVEGGFWELISRLCREKGKTVLAVMHNIGDAVRLSDKIVLLDSGNLLYFGDTKTLLLGTLLEETLSVKRYLAEENGEKRIFFAPKTR